MWKWLLACSNRCAKDDACSRAGRLRCVSAALALTLWGAAHAAISLGSTRVVITEPQGQGTVDVRNEGATPVLLQVWLDQGDVAVPLEDLYLPLIVETPVLRLEAGRRHTLRLHFTGRPAVAQQRESLYWLNVQEVPLQPAGVVGNRVQVAFRTRIKVMYRPLGLAAGAQRAWADLQFSMAGTGTQGMLRIRNPAKVHVTLLSLATEQGGLRVPAEGLLTPQGELELALDAAQARALASGSALQFVCIDDAGNLVGATWHNAQEAAP